MAAAVIAASAIAAAGSLASAGVQAYGASQAAKAGKGSAHKIPLPRYQRGLQSYYARMLAANMLAEPPSFADYVKSGGTATFPMKDLAFTPREARELGFVGKHGEQIPYVQPGQTSLTPEQKLYLGSQQIHDPGMAGSALARAYQLNQRVGRILGRPDTPKREQRVANLRAKRDRLLGSQTMNPL